MVVFAESLEATGFDGLWLSDLPVAPVLDPLLGLALATARTDRLDLGALTHLGWQSGDGAPIGSYDLYRLRALDVLRNISHARPRRTDRCPISPEAAELARAALRTSN